MELEKLERLAKLVLKEMGEPYGVKLYINPHLEAKFKNLMVVARESLPEHAELFSIAHKRVDREYYGLTNDEAKSIIFHLLSILEIEKASSQRIKEMKIFESAEEKMKQAALSFQNEDFSSTFHCLNTAFELVLKDKIGIPMTITGINTSNIVEVLVKHRVEPYLYFQEVKKRVTEIDNKVKHQGYSPSKIDAINGIKAMEDLISRLRGKELELTEEIKNKICEGL